MTDFGEVARFMLLLVRPGMLVMGTPFLGALYAPVQVRAGLTILIALMLAPSVPTPAILSPLALVLVVGRELAIGAAIAMGVQLLTTSAEFAGQLTGYQTGMSYGSMVDPQSGKPNTTVASVYSTLIVVLCFATNVHHALLRALASSYAALPIGVGAVDGGLVVMVERMLGMVFTMGLRLAAPVVVVLLVVELVIGLMARVAPALNLMAIGAPLRVPIGLLVVALAVTALPALLAKFVPLAFRLAADTARAFR